MALTNASRLADFGTGIGTQGAILQVDNADQMVGIGTTDPTAQLEVKQDFKVGGASTITGALTVSGDLTASGNVTIGGTLTYEDVTNIDSVGLITARSGINVSGGEFKVGTALTVGSAGVTTFSSNLYIKNTYPRIYLTDTDTNSDFSVINANGAFMIYDDTNSANRFTINSSGVVAANSDLEVAGSQYITDSIIHTGDTNTKIRFPIADTVSVETAGSERVRIGAAGIVTSYATHPQIVLEDPDGRAVSFRSASTSNNAALGTDSNHDLAFYTNGYSNERLRINNSGDVKINNTRTTSTKLQVVGGTASGTAYDVAVFAGGQNSTSGSGARIYLSGCENDPIDRGTVIEGLMTDNSNAHALIFKTSASSAAPTERLRIESGGDVGINTNNPTVKLDISEDGVAFPSAAGSTLLRLRNSGGTATISIDSAANANSVIQFGDTAAASVGTIQYSHTTNHLQFNTNGDGEKMRISSDGKIINTATNGTAATLDLYGGNTSVSAIEEVNAQIRFRSKDTSVSNTDNVGGTIRSITEFSNGAYVGLSFETFKQDRTPQLQESLRLNFNGDVLAGTSTSRTINSHVPKLQVTGYDYGDSTVSIINNENNANGSYLFFGKQRSGGPNGSTVVAANDIIGELRFNAGDGSDLDNISARIVVEVDGTPGSNDTPGRMAFYTTPDGSATATERMRLTSGGQLLINRTSSASADQFIQINGEGTDNGVAYVYSESGLANNKQLGWGAGDQNRDAFFGIFKNGSNNPGSYMRVDTEDDSTTYAWFDNNRVMRMDSNFSNIGTTTGTVIGSQSSDIRLKDLIGDGSVTYGLSEINQINPIKFKYKKDSRTSLDKERGVQHKVNIGFSAQQVKPIVPECVYDTGEEVEGEENIMAMEYVDLIPVLVNAVKELSAENNALKARLDAAGL